MRWFPWATGAAALLGGVAGAIFPGRSLGHTNDNFVAFMTPPTAATGELAALQCGWHDGQGCNAQGSPLNALDWNDGAPIASEQDVYFRGWFVLFDHPDAYTLTATSKAIFDDPNTCDRMDVEIWEDSISKHRATMQYVHAHLTSPQQDFAIKTGDYPGLYNNLNVGHTADDSINCAWSGHHVHEKHKPGVDPAVSEILSTLGYPTGFCGVGVCSWHRNDDLPNWTRHFVWTEAP